MRHVYLFRHCEPDFPDNIRVCLGRRCNPSLSIKGKEDAKALSESLREFDISCIYSSPMLRCVETAEILSNGRWPVEVLEDAIELDSGVWDGLTFKEIKEKYKESWDAHLVDPTIVPPGGETDESGYERLKKLIIALLEKDDRDIVIVTHGSLIRAFSRFLNRTDLYNITDARPVYGAVTVLQYDGKELKISAKGIDPIAIPSDDSVKNILNYFKTPQNILDHCKATAIKALEMADGLDNIDKEMLRVVSEIHDMAKVLKDHMTIAGDTLRSLGYLKAGFIAEHHGGYLKYEGIDESKILFLADKYTHNTDYVTIKERFDMSLSKCITPEAIAAHDRRLANAEKIENEYLEYIRSIRNEKTL